MSKRDEDHMMAPTQPTTYLVMVKADFAFGFFEDSLSWPAHATDPYEIAQGRVRRAVAEVVFDLAGSSRLRRMIHQSTPSNLKEAFAFANQVDAGVVKINEPTTGLALNAPFGGIKRQYLQGTGTNRNGFLYLHQDNLCERWITSSTFKPTLRVLRDACLSNPIF